MPHVLKVVRHAWHSEPKAKCSNKGMIGLFGLISLQFFNISKGFSLGEFKRDAIFNTYIKFSDFDSRLLMCLRAFPFSIKFRGLHGARKII